MVSLQPKLNLRVAQKQILTPGLVQMVSVLALNKLELKEMINTELMENPLLDQLEENVPLLDDAARKEEERIVAGPEEAPREKTDSFDEIDFGSFFRDYLDPGYRSPGDFETTERPSFENFLSSPTNLADHLTWQLGAMNLRPEVREAAELVIGNLSEDGYLIATEEELLDAAYDPNSPVVEDPEARTKELRSKIAQFPTVHVAGVVEDHEPVTSETEVAVEPEPQSTETEKPKRGRPLFDRSALLEAIAVVRQLDPVGVGARDLRECLLAQLEYQKNVFEESGKLVNGTAEALEDAIHVVDYLKEIQNKQFKDIAKAINRPIECVQKAVDYIRTLDPRPGLRYNKAETRLIEPDVAIIKQGDDYLVILNDEDVPQLRLNPTYKRMLSEDGHEKDVKNYVKDKYKSALQLIKNIEQRKQTILKVCYVVIARQREFLDRGIDYLRPMMIKEVAEEIGVHPSTVSRAVASKYAHTPQGVFELRYFFSESVQGPEGGGTSLLILKRRVKKLIEEEDPARPLTDEQITRILQSQGIQVTRRTVAKYREDMKIPSTHQRRVKS